MIDYAALNSWAALPEKTVAPTLVPVLFGDGSTRMMAPGTWSLGVAFKHQPTAAPHVARPAPALPGPTFTAAAYLLGAGAIVLVTLAAFAFLGPWALLLFCPAVVVVRPEKGWSK